MRIDGTALRGIRVHGNPAEAETALKALLGRLGLSEAAALATNGPCSARHVDASIKPATAAQWLPDFDTTGLAQRLGLDTEHSTGDLEKEILVGLLASPLLLEFPSVDELLANIHIRRNIVVSGRKTELNFDTTAAADRPDDCWLDDDERGFTVRPGCSLIDALKKATQPELTGHLYSFSCYRATEYVILLAIAKELALRNPPLLAQLQHQCETRFIRSGQFHDVFLYEYGSQDAPFPTRYYVPGDRVWFRNPDEPSSDLTGYEGSWVLYLGGGLFTNFWKHNRPYTLTGKCLEIYHWRHGLHRTAAGELAMDESIVEAKVEETLGNPAEAERIVERMMRWRDPKGVYAEGGCIDTTREGPRCICPETADLPLPAAP